MRIKYIIVLIFSFGLILIPACTASWEDPPPDKRRAIQRDPLSYGAVTSKVKRNETTQEEIVRLFGAPNITTINSDGEEVWVYDRISNDTQTHGWSEARRFCHFFVLGTYSSKYGSGRSSSTRTLTVIITFNKNKSVKEYSARATQF